MINLFRKIRHKILTDKRLTNSYIVKASVVKYLLYAIGEIFLVVIGILIALQINNWNENRKSKIMADEVYANLLTSLKQDSIEVRRTIDILSASLATQRNLISHDEGQYGKELSQNDLDKTVGEIVSGVMSFFPKTGVYDLITSNNSMDLLKSKQIKSLLINLYDFQYKRYENVDAIIDNKYHYELGSLIRTKIGFVGEFNSESKFTILKHANSNHFNEYYEELVLECQDVYGLLSTGKNYLVQISASINELLELIRDQLNK
jgi:hypothetical protein